MFYLSEVDFGKEIFQVSTNINQFKLEGENYDADFGGEKIKKKSFLRHFERTIFKLLNKEEKIVSIT